MSLEKLDLEHIPPSYQVYAAYFRDVANTEFLHKQLLSRNTEFQYAFIDASSVISRLHILSAVYSAVNVLLDGTLRTPNVHSEMVVSLNINNNVRSHPFSVSPDPDSMLTLPRSRTPTDDGAYPPAKQKTLSSSKSSPRHQPPKTEPPHQHKHKHNRPSGST